MTVLTQHTDVKMGLQSDGWWENAKKVSNNQSINYQGEKYSLANTAIAGLLTLANVCCPLTEWPLW